MILDRRQLVKGVFVAGMMLGSCSPSLATSPLTPEQFGAAGDGKAADGRALAALIDHVNAISGTEPVVVRFRGRYLLAGAPIRLAAPSRREGAPGTTRGLPAVTRSNVTFDATGSEFTVPSDFPFRRVVRGGSDADSFFVLWQFLGDNIRFVGGVIDGNLANRPIERGPRPMGFGGAEFGFVLEGANWKLENLVVRNWGTDCALAMNYGSATDCTFERARRNGMSVVAGKPITSANPLIVKNCLFVANGDWPDDVYNNPAAGMVVEAGRQKFDATVIIRDNEFRNNKLKDLQLAKSAVDCIVIGNIFTGDLRLRPLQKGGHVIEGNEFRNGARILVTSTGRDAKPVVVRKNTQDGRPQPERGFIRHSNSRVAGANWDQEIEKF